MELNKKSCPWQPARIRPPLDEPVLIITRQGSIWKRTFRKYLSVEEPMFSPDALKLGKDVLWWMPVPDDNWHDCAVEKPAVETWVLLKDQYGVENGAMRCPSAKIRSFTHSRDIRNSSGGISRLCLKVLS